MKKNKILIGFMGSGKSTIGRRLAAVSGREFLDTDQWIEHREKRKIADIFSTDGEAYFRDQETEFLKTLVKEKKDQGWIISVGGGLPVRKENRQLLRQLGDVIYLKARPETIYDRIRGDKTRPLLQTKDPESRIREMLGEREELYMAAAGYVIMTDKKNIEEIVQEIQAISCAERKQ